MSNSKNKHQTPNKDRKSTVTRSPPTPAEKLNEGSKKSCHSHSSDDDNDETDEE